MLLAHQANEADPKTHDGTDEFHDIGAAHPLYTRLAAHYDGIDNGFRTCADKHSELKSIIFRPCNRSGIIVSFLRVGDFRTCHGCSLSAGLGIVIDCPEWLSTNVVIRKTTVDDLVDVMLAVVLQRDFPS
jgi:hypothetical protein